MSWTTLETERRGDVLYVWLARPECLNALNGTALEEVAALFTELQTAFDVRAVVLGGRGRSFCAGADRKDPPGSEIMRRASEATERERRWASQVGLRACRAIEDCEIPTVARIHGHAVGGGIALALACDFRIAAAGTVFSVPEVDLGIPLSWGATARLIQECWGAVHKVVAAERLDEEVDSWASRLAAKPELAVHMTKTQLRAYAHSFLSGAVREGDGDMLAAASRSVVAKMAFSAGDD
jgi:enoyl-CoA hydratase/carnithine racemase